MEPPSYAGEQPKTMPIVAIVAGAGILCCVCAVVIAIAALGARTSLLDLLFGPKQAAAQVLPADADFLLTLNTAALNSEEYQRLYDVYSDLLEEKDTVQNLEDRLEEEYGIVFEEDIQPWLGRQVGLALLDINEDIRDLSETLPTLEYQGHLEQPPAASPPQNILILAAETRDREASDALIQKLAENLEDDYEISEETYQDISYYVGEGAEGEMALGTVGRFVVLTNDPGAIEDVIDVYTGNAESLAENPAYSALMRQMPRNAAALVYYDVQDLVDLILDRIEEGAFEMATCSMGEETLEAYRSLDAAFGMALILNDEGIRADMVTSFDPDALPQETLEQFEASEGPDRILARVPSDALGFLSAQIPPTDWNAWEANLEKCPDLELQIEDIEEATGLRIDQELLGWLAGEMALVVIEADGPEGSSPVGIFWTLESSDAEAARNALEEIIGAIEESSQGEVEFEEETIGGIEMHVIIDPRNEEIAGGYGVTERYVVIGVTEDALETAVADDITPITEDETFQRVQANLPEDNTGYIYANIGRIWQLSYDRMDEYSQERFDRETRPYVEPIEAVGIASARVDPRQGYSLTTLFLYIPGE